MSKKRGDFYVGYQKHAPTLLAKKVRKTVIRLLVLSAGVAVLIAAVQEEFTSGTYAYGKPTTLEGVIYSDPYPSVEITSEIKDKQGHPSSVLLVSEGKFGGANMTEGTVGEKVRLSGHMISRDGTSMIEAIAGTLSRVEDDGTAMVSHEIRSLGSYTFRGEIVDSKCYLGVMSPGNLKTHKACAIRCISGGIPPLFLVKTSDGETIHLFLVDSNGGAVNDRILDMIAEPLEISGTLEKKRNLLTLKAEPASYIRL